MSDRPLPPQFTRGPHAQQRAPDVCEHRRVWEITTRVVNDPPPRAIQIVGFCLDCRVHVHRKTAPAPLGPWVSAPPDELGQHGKRPGG